MAGQDKIILGPTITLHSHSSSVALGAWQLMYSTKTSTNRTNCKQSETASATQIKIVNVTLRHGVSSC